jgi:hypothetical protein
MIPRFWFEYPWYFTNLADAAKHESLRFTIRREMEHTGVTITELAREMRVLPSSLRGFLRGAQPLTKARDAIEDWGDDRRLVHPPGGAVAVALAVRMYPPPMQQQVRLYLLESLREGYRQRGRVPPGWLLEALEREKGKGDG